MLIVKALISAVVIVAVAEIAGRMPRVGALLLTLPIVSIRAFIMTWNKDHDRWMSTRDADTCPTWTPVFRPVCTIESNWIDVLAVVRDRRRLSLFDDRNLVLDFLPTDKSSIVSRKSSMILVGGDRRIRRSAILFVNAFMTGP